VEERDPVYCQRCGHPTEERPVEGRARPVCPACGAVTYLDPKLAVAVLVARGGRLLLGRRAAGASQAGRWSFPAGFVERGEAVEAAAAREAREEVGLEVTVGRLVGLYSRPGEAVVLAVYAAEARGEPVAGDDLDAVGWFALDALPALAFPHDARIVEDWRRGEATGQTRG
jgi:8-oxo-dGTP diphosphatase